MDKDLELNTISNINEKDLELNSENYEVFA
jgi:hypothetical protein